MVVGRTHFVPSNELMSTVVAITHRPGKRTSSDDSGHHPQHVREVRRTRKGVVCWRLQTRLVCNVND